MHNERGALIIRNDNGGYELVNLRVGPSVFSGEGAQVQPDHTGINPANIVGYVHNHPSDGWLSAPDHAVANFYQNLIWQYGGTQEFRMYLINNLKEIKVWDVDSMYSLDGLDVTADCS
jgi:proteasome lid subunit RPN8/RPN11